MANEQMRRVNETFPLGEIDPAASARDTTGMIPAWIRTEDQAESYEELMPIHRQRPPEKGDVVEGVDGR